jgi:hypothetical protein
MSLAGPHHRKDKERNNEESVMRGYLLGDVDESVLEQIEDRLLRDKAYAERLSAAEDNLIDDYVFDGLSENEREKFHANFLIDNDRRNKIRIAQAFEAYVGDKLPQQPRDYLTPAELWHTSLLFIQRHKVVLTCSAVAIVLLAVLIPKLKVIAPNSVVSQINAQRDDLERRLDLLNQNGNDNQPAVEATLQSKRFREGSETQRVVVPKSVRFIKLTLQLGEVNHYQKYRASVQNVEGTELFKVNNLKTDANGAVVLKLTVDALAPGDYQIQLMGGASEKTMSNVALYHLRVIHEG